MLKIDRQLSGEFGLSGFLAHSFVVFQIQRGGVAPLTLAFRVLRLSQTAQHWVKRETIEVETLRHQPSTFPRNIIYIKLPAEDRQNYGEDNVDRLVKSMYGTQDPSHIWQLPDLWRFRRLPKRQTQISTVSQSNSRCEDGSAWRRLCVFVR